MLSGVRIGQPVTREAAIGTVKRINITEKRHSLLTCGDRKMARSVVAQSRGGGAQ